MVTLNQMAVGFSPGAAMMFDDIAFGSETSSFASLTVNGTKRELLGTVSVTSVDAYLGQHPEIDEVFVMKIDIEGFDIWGLAGAMQSVKAGKFTAIVLVMIDLVLR